MMSEQFIFAEDIILKAYQAINYVMPTLPRNGRVANVNY